MDRAKIVEAAKALIAAAGIAGTIYTTDIDKRAETLAKQYSGSSARSIADEISREIRKAPRVTISSR